MDKLRIHVPCNAGNASALTLSAAAHLVVCRDHFRLRLGSDLHSADTRTGFHLLRLSVPFSDELLSSSLPFAKNLVSSIDSESENVKRTSCFYKSLLFTAHVFSHLRSRSKSAPSSVPLTVLHPCRCPCTAQILPPSMRGRHHCRFP